MIIEQEINFLSVKSWILQVNYTYQMRKYKRCHAMVYLDLVTWHGKKWKSRSRARWSEPWKQKPKARTASPHLPWWYLMVWGQWRERSSLSTHHLQHWLLGPVTLLLDSSFPILCPDREVYPRVFSSSLEAVGAFDELPKALSLLPLFISRSK